VRLRVDELAGRAGLSVDTVRFYQTKGLLPAPEREGRVAWYSDAHLERLRRIQDLKAKGFTLGSIKRFLAGDLDAPDRALIDELAGAITGGGRSEDQVALTVEELAERTGVSPALLEALEREGFLVASGSGDSGGARYTASDSAIVSEGLALLETGLPLSELLALARRHDAAMRKIATEAVDLFVRFVRDPIRAGASSEEVAAAELVDAFKKMLPATTTLVAHHFERVLLSVARARIEEDGSDSELAAVRSEEGGERVPRGS
jgi:DNA-binding transcriptional MerR regulator